ncbi:hypothetical protein AKJ16_DCAP20118 [Drosera capensis]
MKANLNVKLDPLFSSCCMSVYSSVESRNGDDSRLYGVMLVNSAELCLMCSGVYTVDGNNCSMAGKLLTEAGDISSRSRKQL